MADVLCKSQPFAGTCRRCCLSSSLRSPTKTMAVSCPPSSSSVGFEPLKSSSSSGFHGRKVVVADEKAKHQQRRMQAFPIQLSLTIGKAMRWWEKGLQSNMKEIHSAQELVESLLNAGNKLVIVDFFSPGCGGCRALHPKICQFAEMNPDVQFLQVNYEEHKSMCYSLNVHVLPFFRFYRGAQGRVCSFSCTNATIKKFRDSLAKHGTDRCSLGPAKGLEESELLALAANKDLGFNYTRKPESVEEEEEVTIPETSPPASSPKVPAPAPAPSKATKSSDEKEVVTAWS